jgi:simple sugar transport system ATP-binding protein
MHVAFGLVRPDQGSILVDGSPVTMTTPGDAKARGIGMVHQHFTSIEALTVQESLWLAAGRSGHPSGGPPLPGPGVTAGDRLRSRLWEGLRPTSKVAQLAVGAKQRLELLQALATGADVLLLDEPTAVLAPAEVDGLLELLREFAAGGGSVVFITHKLNEVVAAVDRVTVLRRGRVTWSGAARGRTTADLATAMVGGDEGRAGFRPPLRIASRGPTRVRARDGDLEVRSGEVVGIAAVEGNGQRELLRSLAGLLARESGMVVADPVAFIPEDRTTEGLVPTFTLTENLVLGLPDDPRWSRGPWVQWDAVERRMDALIEEFGIRAAGPKALTRTLSGGNQQKLLLARVVEGNPAVVIAENPTRGLDFQATLEVHDRLRGLARNGAAVVVYSTDLDEVLELADRVLVMYRGAVVPVPSAAEPSRATVGSLMLGGGVAAEGLRP